jgi:hypothetical protein
MYIGLNFLHKRLTKVKPGINGVAVHPQLSHSWHPSGWCAPSNQGDGAKMNIYI